MFKITTKHENRYFRLALPHREISALIVVGGAHPSSHRSPEVPIIFNLITYNLFSFNYYEAFLIPGQSENNPDIGDYLQKEMSRA
jgi:hypothetical protein